jgi:hypothetical protein
LHLTISPAVEPLGKLMPIISAACQHMIFPALARNNTSSTFIARSTVVEG